MKWVKFWRFWLRYSTSFPWLLNFYVSLFLLMQVSLLNFIKKMKMFVSIRRYRMSQKVPVSRWKESLIFGYSTRRQTTFGDFFYGTLERFFLWNTRCINVLDPNIRKLPSQKIFFSPLIRFAIALKFEGRIVSRGHLPFQIVKVNKFQQKIDLKTWEKFLILGRMENELLWTTAQPPFYCRYSRFRLKCQNREACFSESIYVRYTNGISLD